MLDGRPNTAAGRSRAGERRGQILAAVLACLGEGGFDAVSMRAVAHRASVPLGSLHYYFRSKEEMVGAALARSVEATVAGVIAGVDETDAPRGRLRALVVEALPRLCADPALVPVYIGFWSWCQKVPERRALYHQVSEGVHARLRMLVEEGVRGGDFHPGDPGVAATLVLSTLVGFLLDHHGAPPPVALVEGLHARLEAALGVA
ncbi:MAG TPA: TetR/AcrR family transcriptional regulator [Candidatus Dormibacteraeota bacterium]|jgi:AcrR family transcriptional regulator|nr:TetR/AcrR family transcriptional regulator [Candidatus Dormibacteraeota bacterium]